MGEKPPEAHEKPAAGVHPIVGCIRNVIFANSLNKELIDGCPWLYGIADDVIMNA
jgi:hypothetical protein